MHYFLKFSFIEEIFVSFLNMQNYFSSSFKGIIFNLLNFEGSTSIWAPLIGWLSWNFWNNLNSISNNEWWIETNTKLTNNVILNGSTFLFHFFHKLFWSTLSDGSQMANEIFSWHANTIVLNDQLIFGWWTFNVYTEVFIRLSQKSLFL